MRLKAEHNGNRVELYDREDRLVKVFSELTHGPTFRQKARRYANKPKERKYGST